MARGYRETVDPELAQELRREYEAEGLQERDMAADPFTQFTTWFDVVLEAGLHEPNAFVLATADAKGRPSARAVLMKEFDERGVVFYTGLGSRKSQEIHVNPTGAATFVWTPLHRQVRFEGPVVRVSDQEADRYFATRPRGAQLAAHASDQSEVVRSRQELEDRLSEVATRFGEGMVPRPDDWVGWRLVPESVEFWQGRPDRFHDRVVYRGDGSGWMKQRLAP
jgi:pyridoxamine 5'-phosphate oxidase